MTLRDTKPGDLVISNAWAEFEWRQATIPRELIVVEHVKDCVWCKPADSLSEDKIPLYAELVCRRAV